MACGNSLCQVGVCNARSFVDSRSGERLAGVSGVLNKGFTVVVRIAVGVCAEVSSCLEDRIAVGRWQDAGLVHGCASGQGVVYLLVFPTCVPGGGHFAKRSKFIHCGIDQYRMLNGCAGMRQKG